jgi:arylsulfatase A-like enzyme
MTVKSNSFNSTAHVCELNKMNRPNILLVSIDSLRTDAVSILEGPDSVTPQIDELAEDGIIFPNAITPALWTLPAHTSLFTGLYPAEHGVTGGETRLGDHPTLADSLADHGYETKSYYRLDWLGAGDVLRGFTANDASVTGNSSESTIQESIGDILGSISGDLKQVVRGMYRGTFRAPMPDQRVVTSALNGFNEISEPFCHFVHLNDAHWPYSPTAPYHNQFTSRSWSRLFWNRAYIQRKLYDGERTDYTPSETGVDVAKDLYLGCVRQTDAHLAKLVDGLKQQGLYENTIVIVFGDHGEAFGESGYFGHGDFPIPEVASVPLVIRDPTETIPTGSESDPVQLNDLFPTITDIVGIDPPRTRSKSIVSDHRDVAFTHVFESESDISSTLRYFGVWNGPSDYFVWDERDQLIIQSNGTPPDIEALERHKHDLHQVQPQTDGSLDASAKENLRQLGYLE